MYLLLAATSGTAGSVTKQLFTVISTLVLFVVILYLAYLASKMVGKRYTPGGFGKKNMQVLESVTLAPNKNLMLVSIGEKTLLIGVTKEQITFLSEVDASTLTFPEPIEGEPLDFAKALKRAAAERFGKRDSAAQTATQEDEDEPKS